MKKVFLLLISFVMLVCVCGCSGKEKAEHEHTYSDTFLYDKNSHWLPSTCEHTLKKSIEPHSFTEWNTIEEATTSKAGTKTRYCIKCNYKETEEIPKIQVKYYYVNLTENNIDDYFKISTFYNIDSTVKNDVYCKATCEKRIQTINYYIPEDKKEITFKVTMFFEITIFYAGKTTVSTTYGIADFHITNENINDKIEIEFDGGWFSEHTKQNTKFKNKSITGVNGVLKYSEKYN